MTTAYPLAWPAGWARTALPGSSQFKTTLAGAIKNVQGSLALFAKDSGKRMENVLVSSNVSLIESNPKDSGVAVYFTWDGISTCIAVDRYKKIEENLQAIHHVIEAERTKLRHGGLNLVRAAFRGYAALPPPSDAANWWLVLDCQEHNTDKSIMDAYKELAKKNHPDNGGSVERMTQINAAYAAFKKVRGLA